MRTRMRLENWIDPRHLDASAAAARAAEFAASPYAAVVLDSFLQAGKLTALQRLFSTEGEFAERRTMWRAASSQAHRAEQPVSAEVWQAAPEKQRAASERTLVGPKSEYRLGFGVTGHFKFVELLRSPEFMDFLAAVTGIRPATLTGIQVRVMSSGDYVQPHSDRGIGRSLCAIFYVSGGWQPRFGGRFRHCGPGSDIFPVEPYSNRFLVFDPRRGYKHDVEPLSANSDGWARWSYTLWFGESQER